ncbi:MAG: hypothetical protein WA137_10465 [Methanothrix sp.]
MDSGSYRPGTKDLPPGSLEPVRATYEISSLFFGDIFTHTATRYFYKYLSSSVSRMLRYEFRSVICGSMLSKNQYRAIVDN